MIAEPSAPTKRTAQITKEDIRNGVKENMFRCPIALGIMRSIPSAEFVKVWGGVEVWFEDGSFVARRLTDEEGEFIKAFDAGLDVEPIEVEIPVDIDVTVGA